MPSYTPELDAYQQGLNGVLRERLGRLQQAQGVLGLQGALAQQLEAQQTGPMRRQLLEAQIGQLKNPAPTRVDVGSHISLRDRAGNEVGQIPKGPTPDALVRAATPRAGETTMLSKLIAERNALPQGDPRRAAYDDAIKKQTTREPPIQINMPTASGMTEIKDASGKIIKGAYQVGRDGKLIFTPIGEAPPTAAAAKAAKEAGEQELTVDSVRARVKRMSELIQGNAGVVGPAGIARRMGETVVGAIPGAGGIPTPAIDYENEKNLMVADVRKLIEKDPNLSNQERETLSRTLGSGTFQTPGSAIRTLNNVVSFIEGKKLYGQKKAGIASPKTQQEFNALPSGAAYIDPDDGRRYRKP